MLTGNYKVNLTIQKECPECEKIFSSICRCGYTDDLLVEYIAELEHQQWIYWAKANMRFVSETKQKMWEENFKSYNELPEDIKEKDRFHARKMIMLLKKLNLKWRVN